MPHHNPSNLFKKPVSDSTPTTNDSSFVEFNLLGNVVPPTPYRDVGSLTPDNIGTRSCNRNEAVKLHSVIPLVLDNESP